MINRHFSVINRHFLYDQPPLFLLQLKASRAVFSVINRHFPAMPFTLRALVEAAEKDEKSKDLTKQLKLGLVECLNHALLVPYPVLHEKTGELVAQVKGTVLLMPNGTDQVRKGKLLVKKHQASLYDQIWTYGTSQVSKSEVGS